MDRSSAKPTPPDGLPDGLVSELHQLDAAELRNAIIHAQELLHFHEERPSPIEAHPGEDILRVTEREGYTEVVKLVPCDEGCADCPHGPYLYHVRHERHSDGHVNPHWVLIGEIVSDDE